MGIFEAMNVSVMLSMRAVLVSIAIQCYKKKSIVYKPLPVRAGTIQVDPQTSPHDPHEVARVFNTIAEILAASAEIIRRDEVYHPICVRCD